ncbi:MAG: HypC/HybG/HupF family hydrogenase formation chaperone [Desulfovibrionaceae bacterium]|nr:HypC/HybG/HupF family hydrogenase formation chaperone [Desulfovibrionaceae bacterium]
MCLAIPTQVVEILDNTMMKVRVGNGPTLLTASSMLLPEPPAVGDYLIVHAGFALRRLDPTEAQESLAALMEFAMAAEASGELAQLDRERAGD